ncbi:MAG: 16S rRNA (uracil(1498)-N(3))-methyltransferase [Bacillota bacterium]
MEHFFVEPSAIEGSSAVITGEDAAHIARVLRMRPGDEIHIADGRNNEYRARLLEVDKQAVHAELLGRCASTAEPAHHFTLYQALPKAGKMEVIIQKCVELGVSRITPVLTERCVVRPDGDFEKKRLRYQRVAYEAAKQSGRAVIPQVTGLVSLTEIDFAAHGMLLHAYEEEHGVTLRQILRKNEPPKDIALFIGPEGGFEEEEAALLARSGAVAVSLGPRILRTETAGMAMLAMLIYELEG